MQVFAWVLVGVLGIAAVVLVALWMRARIALDAWDFENVERRVQVCLDINPRSAEAYVVLAALRMIERRFEEAISVENLTAFVAIVAIDNPGPFDYQMPV